MNDRQVTNILKLLILGLQLAVVVILVLSGIQFKDTKEARKFLEPVKDNSDSWFLQLDFKHHCLLITIICLSIETPITLASLFLNNYIVMCVAAVFKSAAAGSYSSLLVIEIAFSSLIEPSLGVPIAGMVITLFSGSITAVLARRIRKGRM